MNHLWNLVKKELRELLTPSSIVTVLVIVVMFMALGSFIGNEVESETSTQPIAYVDLTGSDDPDDYSNVGIAYVKAYYLALPDFKAEDIDKFVIELNITAGFGTEDFNTQLCNAMKEKDVDSAIVIPSDFNKKISSGQHSSVSAYWNQSSTSIFSSISTLTASNAITYMNNGISARLMQERTTLTPEEIAFVKSPCSGFTSTTFFNGTVHENVTPADIYSALNNQTMFVPIIIMIIIVMIGSIVISSMGNEKENKTLETLLTLPVGRTTIVAGKLIGSAIAGLIMGALYMVGMYFYINGLTKTMSSGVTVESLGLSLSIIDWVIVAAFVFLSILCALGMCMILGAFAKNTKTAQLYIMPIAVLAMLPMFVTMFSDINSLPAAFQTVLFIIPFTHPMTIIQNLMFNQTAMIAGGAVYLVVFTLITMFVTVKIYNSDILLTGFIRKKSKKKNDDDEQPE